MDDLVNANQYSGSNSDEDIEDVMAEEERRRMQRRGQGNGDPKSKRQMRLRGMDQGLHNNEPLENKKS